MAKIIIEFNPCDVGGPYGTTLYYCSECYKGLANSEVEECPKCGAKLEGSEFKTHPGFGGHDFV